MKKRLLLWIFFCVLLGYTLGYLGRVNADGRPPLQTELLRGYYLSKGDDGIYNAFKVRLNKYTQIRPVSFMGRRVLLHEVTREPLRCVERYIHEHCGEYEIKAMSGWRPTNTFKAQSNYKRQEYSNHVFGLALDINPQENPCCGCVKDWAKSPLCLPENGARFVDSGAPLGAYSIPQCWIDAFKQHGFHWLGDDALRDTMHFEYLAEPGAVSCLRNFGPPLPP